MTWQWKKNSFIDFYSGVYEYLGFLIALTYCAKAYRKCAPVVRKVSFVVQRPAALADRPGDLQTEKDGEIPLALQRK